MTWFVFPERPVTGQHAFMALLPHYLHNHFEVREGANPLRAAQMGVRSEEEPGARSGDECGFCAAPRY